MGKEKINRERKKAQLAKNDGEVDNTTKRGVVWVIRGNMNKKKKGAISTKEARKRKKI